MSKNTKISVTLTPKLRLEQALRQAGVKNPATVTHLTIAGTLVEDDLQYIRENMRETVQVLDMRYSSIAKLENFAFCDCTGLKAIIIPNSEIETDLNVFNENMLWRNFVTIPYVNGMLFQKFESGMLYNLSEIPRRVLSGFTKLDEMTGGWHSGDFVIIAGRPAMGKTSFALSVARNMAIDNGCDVAIFSLEMSEKQMLKRIVSIETELGCNNASIPTNKIELEQLNKKIRKLFNAPIHIDDTPALSVSEFRDKCLQLKEKSSIGIAIIDYLQMMTLSDSCKKETNREKEMLNILQTLKETAIELNIPIIALCELNRLEESKAVKRLDLSDLQVKEIEQHADNIIFMCRPEIHGITEDGEGNSLRGIADFIIAKNRNGIVGDVRLKFDKDIGRFENLKI